MIVNAPSILAVLFALLEFLAGGALLVGAIRGLRATARPDTGEFAWEPLRHLLLLLVLLLALLSVISLFVWILVLQSHVSQWAGLKCVVGVLRVGTGREGTVGWLPALAVQTTWLRLAFLFAAGVGVVLHLAGRDVPEGPLGRRHLFSIAAIGLLALLGAATETAWIVVPKQDQSLTAGCCTGFAAMKAGSLAPLSRGEVRALFAGLVATGLALATILTILSPRSGRFRAAGDVLRILAGAAFLALGIRFATEVISPARLGLPLHRCAYCLGAIAPETLVGFALLPVPLLAGGWRAAARCLGPGHGPALDRLSRRLDGAALFGAFGATLLFAGEWIVS